MGGRFVPPPLGPYQYHEVISALRKTIKLADEEAAIYWVHVLMTYLPGNKAKTIAKQLWIMAAEDIDDPMVVLRATATYQMASIVGESDHSIFLTAQMCHAMALQEGKERLSVEEMVLQLAQVMVYARKWWEHPEGRKTDWYWSKALGDLKRGLEDPSVLRPIPEVALDQHTRRGHQLAKTNGGMRDELSGTEKGRMKTIWQFLTTGRLDYDVRVYDDEPGFQELYIEQRQLQGEPPPDLPKRRMPPMPKMDEADRGPEPGLFPEPENKFRQGGPTQICEM